MGEIIAETKRKEAGGANVKDGTATEGLTGETGAGKRCKFQGTDCEPPSLPSLLPDPKMAGQKLHQLAWGSEVHQHPQTLVLSPRPRGQWRAEGDRQCRFPMVSPGVAGFLGSFPYNPPESSLPKDPSLAPAALSPPFSHRSEGARDSLMLSRVCLSHPSRVAGGGKHEKEPIWLLTSPPALLSLSSPLPYQPPTP